MKIPKLPNLKILPIAQQTTTSIADIIPNNNAVFRFSNIFISVLNYFLYLLQTLKNL